MHKFLKFAIHLLAICLSFTSWGARGQEVLTAQLVIQRPHGYFQGARLSPDRKILATIGGNESINIKIWEFQSGFIIRDILVDMHGIADQERRIRFIDSQRLLVAEDAAVRIIDVWTGAELGRLAYPNDLSDYYVETLLIHEDGDRVIVGGGMKKSDYGWAVAFDIQSGALLAKRSSISFEVEWFGRRDSSSFLAFGKFRREGDKSGRPCEIAKWEDLSANASFDYIGTSEFLGYVEGGRDLMAWYDEQKDFLTIYDKSGSSLQTIHTLKHSKEVRGKYFLDRDLLLSWTGDSVHLWNLETGRQIHELKVEGEKNFTFQQAFMDENSGMLNLGYARYNVEECKFDIPYDVKRSVGFDHYIGQKKDEEDSVYFVAREPKPPPWVLVKDYLGDAAYKSGIPYFRYSSNQGYIAQVVMKTLAVWELQEFGGILKHQLPKRTYDYEHIEFSPDEELVCFLPGRAFSVPKDAKFSEYVPDSKVPMPVLVFSLPDGQEVARIPLTSSDGETFNSEFAAFSPSGKILAIGDSAKGIALINCDTWDTRKILPDYRVTALKFISPNTLLFACGRSISQAVMPWGIVSGGVCQSQFGKVIDIHSSASGRLMTTVTANGSVEFWELPNFRKMLSCVILPAHNWIFYTPEGHFDCSANAGQYLAWNMNGRIYAFEQFQRKFRNPGLVRDILYGKISPRQSASSDSATSIDGKTVVKVTRVDRDILGLDAGSSQGLKIGLRGRVYYRLTIGNAVRNIYIATIVLTEVDTNMSTASVEAKTKELEPGLLVEIEGI